MNKTKYLGIYENPAKERFFKGKSDTCFYITYKDNRKKIWEKVGWLSEGYSAKLAGNIRAERLRSLRHGQELPKQKKKAPFFHDVAEQFFMWGKDNLSKGGLHDRSRYDNHLKNYFNGKRLNEVNSFDLERLKQELKKKNLADQSIKHILVLFRRILNKAISWGLYEGPNPLKNVKMPVPQNQRERFLTHEEIALLLERLKGKSSLWHDITLIALHTGLRASEIFSLRGYDLDFGQELIGVDDTKTKHPRKAIMTAAVKKIFKNRNPKNPSDLVFLNRKGEKITEVSKIFSRTIDELGFNQGVIDNRQRVVFHTCRHTFASWLAIQGTPLHVIAELTGHRQMSMVQRYSHLSPDVRRRAVEQAVSGFNQLKKKNEVKITEAV